MKEIIDNFKYVFVQNYANFEGRARRSEYWLYQLVLYFLYMIVMIPFMCAMAFMLIDMIGNGGSGAESKLVGVFILYFVFLGLLMLILFAILLPTLGATVRRLHDTNRSGWWTLLAFIPLGGLIVAVFLIQDSDEGRNEYGADPKEEERTYYRNLVLNESASSNVDPQQQGYVQNY